MLYDSDGFIFDNTVEELLKPFYADEKVYAVCGHINARNAHDQSGQNSKI